MFLIKVEDSHSIKSTDTSPLGKVVRKKECSISRDGYVFPLGMDIEVAHQIWS